jgi:DNA polymerase-1
MPSLGEASWQQAMISMAEQQRLSADLVLVDGSSYLYRAYHALPPLTTSRGMPTGAVFGVVTMLQRLDETVAAPRVAVVMDAPGPTFRDALFEAYKAQRAAMPEALVQQLGPVRQVIRALGYPLLEVSGVEADDVIATLANEARARGMTVLIVSGDKDLAQLVGPGVRLYDTMADRLLDESGVVEHYGVPPQWITAWLALKGDASDNIPGIPGVGGKTAARWLHEYGGLEGLLQQREALKGRAGQALRDHATEVARWLELVTLRRDVPLPIELDALQRSPPDETLLRRLYSDLEFTSLRRKLPGAAPLPIPAAADPAGSPSSPPAEPQGRETLHDVQDVARWCDLLRHSGCFALDTETTVLAMLDARLVGLSLAVEVQGEAALRACYVPLAHEAGGNVSLDEALALLKPIFEDERVAKLGQNLKFDMHVLANHGMALTGITHDTMLESYVLGSSAGRHDLDSMAARELGHSTTTYESLTGKGASQRGFAEVPIPAAAAYAQEDAELVWRLHRRLWPRLESTGRLASVYRDIEMPLVPILCRMERAGVLVDRARLAEQGKELAERLREIEELAFHEAGCVFNLGSTVQLQEVLFGPGKLPVIRKTPKGAPSTAEDVLEELAIDYRLPRLILEYRSLAKLKSTYIDKLPTMIHPRTGRIHSSFHQAVTATGRLSSSDPNLQNIPARSEEGRRIREAFVAPPGHVLLDADYSQIELRILAHYSGDEALLEAFAAGRDIHRATAATLFHIPEEAVSPAQRRTAKTINFGLIYGMSAFGLARQLRIERELAKRYMDEYFAHYPKVAALMERIRAQARQQGFVETIFGRRLAIPDIDSRDNRTRQYAERTAINAPMQGSAADIIKRAMIKTESALAHHGLPARLILQVHDELVFEVSQEAADRLRPVVVSCMEQAAELVVPLVVNVGMGHTWGEAH